MKVRSPRAPARSGARLTGLTAAGIGPIAGRKVRLAGLAGGGLAAGTRDGWSLEVETFDWPRRSVILKTPDWFRCPTQQWAA